jgi:cellulose synthase/poly-beta-1,6-N-acetylglucosamine synthase-like glycosyltransferase
MRVAVTSAVYNEARNIPRFLDALLLQTRLPDEIVLVDDGSSDETGRLLLEAAEKNPRLRYFHQENKGPASARNKAWKSANADICLFTDGDCVPEPDWIEKLLAPFEDPRVGASAGAYKTRNPESLLARFIGLEIAWRYRNVLGEIDAHGSYNLAVRKSVLEEIGGFKEDYAHPSGEDWDLTYKISKKYKIMFVPEARVAHDHPTDFVWYMKNQMRRGYDRIRVYQDHPDKKNSDTYTGPWVKYQVAAAGLLLLSLAARAFFSTGLVSLALFLFLLATSLIPFPYFLRQDPAAAFSGIGIQMARFFAWFWGGMAGLLKWEALIPGSKRK